MRKARIYYDDQLCGILEETEYGYRFRYTDEGHTDIQRLPVSLTLPKTQQEYHSTILLPFFDVLIPEGYLLEKVFLHCNAPTIDRFGLLLRSGKDAIGAITIEEDNE